MKFKFRHADKIVGLFALIALLLLLIVAGFAGFNKKWFTKKVTFTSLFTSAEGLKVGMGVNLRGFEIGRVKSISLNRDNQVDLVFYIYETYHDRVLPDSVLALPAGLLGAASALDIYPGITGGDPLPDGTYIPSTQTQEGKILVKNRLVDRPEGGDAITGILDQIPDILSGLDVALESIDDLAVTLDAGFRGEGEDSLAKTLRNIDDATATLAQSLQNVDSITASVAELARELESPVGLVPTLLDPSGSLDTLLNDNNELWNRIMSILEQLDGTVGSIRELSASLADVSPQLALALDETIVALKDAQKVMEGLRNNPLLRKGISEEAAPENPGSDMREGDF